MKTHSLTLSPHEAQVLSEVAFDKALHAAWAANWKAYVAAGNEDAVESLELATQRAEYAMADAKAALTAACPGLEIRI